MEHQVKVYVVPKAPPTLSIVNGQVRSEHPPPVYSPGLSFSIEASSLDGAKAAAYEHLRETGQKVRGVSFLVEGGLVAYVTEQETP